MLSERLDPTHEARPSRPILYSLLALLLIVGVVPLAVFGLNIASINREELRLQQDEYQLALAESLAREVSGLLEARRAGVRSVAGSLETALVFDGEAGILRALEEDQLLARRLGEEPDLLKLTFLSLQGGGWQATRSPYKADPQSEGLLLGKAVELAARGEGFVSRAVALANGPRVVMLSAPVLDRGRAVGVVATLLGLSSLERTLSSRTQRRYVVYIVDSGGQLIARSPGVPIQGAERVESPLVAQFIESRGVRTMAFALGRQHKLGAYATISGVDWGAFVEIDEADAYYAVTKTNRSTVFWSAGSVLLAALLGTVFASRLARPLRDLARGARRIADGHFDERIGIESDNEIGQAARSFNFMATAVEEHIVKLQAAAAENKELFLSTVRMLAETIDAKDPYTRGHSERVTRYAVGIARSLGLAEAEIESVQIAALLHDVGKIGIDDRILRKPTVLTEAEFEIMKQHPEKGAQIMGAVKQLRRIIPGMRFHHEKIDGSGYPLGLAGDAIPVAAQIISVADTFDAMTTDRPYQKGMDPEFVLGKLRGWVGSRFRGDVVEAFESAVRAGQISVTRRPEVPTPLPS